MPLLQDLPFAHSLLLNASYRRSDYSEPIDESTDTYGVGLEWAPIDSLKFRGSYQRAVRAPGIIELYQAQGVGLYDNDNDPCAGDVPEATLEQCALTGVTPEQYGTIVDSPAGQYNALFGGSLELTPETADSYTVGFVFQPAFLEGFSLTVDYFNIQVEDVILTIPPTITLAECINTGNPVFCDKVQRDSEGTLWLLPEAQVEALNENIGGLDTSGYDIEVAYTTPIGDMGSLVFRLNGTLLDELTTEPIAGSGSIGKYDCVGLFGPTCTTPNPEWRHMARLTWQTPWNMDLSLGWRHFDAVEVDLSDSNPLLADDFAPADAELDAQDYLDIAGAWTFMDAYTVRLGINNVLDDDPPVSSQVGTGAGNGNTYPQVYDALGRYVFVNLSAKF
ncbi:MAG TPA: TonB-dependent receptor [Steroidobacteraceae bacterium]